MDRQLILGLGPTVAVAVAALQLSLNRKQAKTALEEALTREYREITKDLPIEVFFVAADASADISSNRRARQAMLRYFDLSNEQLRFAREKRITRSAQIAREEGIDGNLALPAFAAAWKDLRGHLSPDHFSELDALLWRRGAPTR